MIEIKLSESKFEKMAMGKTQIMNSVIEKNVKNSELHHNTKMKINT